MRSAFAVRAPVQRLDWHAVKDQVPIEAVAVALLGEPPGRGGARGLWWPCPFHDDRNPSFRVDPDRGRWKCWGCGEHGDAAELVMRLESRDFPEAVRRVADLCGLSGSSGDFRPPPVPRLAKAAERPKAGPSGLPPADALLLVEEAAERLWTRQGEKALSYLHGRGLTDETIRSARLGYVDRATVPSKAGGSFVVSGVFIPWFDGDRLTLVKVRRLDDGKPKYAEVFRNGPRAFPSLDAIRPGRPLVACEGEFDALLLSQELGDFASVVTLGSASSLADADVFSAVRSAAFLYAAHDADDAGDKAAALWPSRAVRVRPPEPDNDWCDVHAGGFNRIRYVWGRYLPLGTPVDELESQSWGGPDDGPEDLGCVADDPTLGEEPRR